MVYRRTPETPLGWGDRVTLVHAHRPSQPTCNPRCRSIQPSAMALYWRIQLGDLD